MGRWWLVPRISATGNPLLVPVEFELTAFLRRIGLGLAAFLIVSLFAVLARQLMEFRDPFAPLAEDLSLLLTGTPWGTSWTAALIGGSLVLLGLALAERWRRGGWILATLGTLALAAFPARTGHANGVESLRALTLAADALHVLAAGLWLGGLGVLLLLLSKLRRSAAPAGDFGESTPSVGKPASSAGGPAVDAIPGLVDSFSHVARLGVGILVVTGVYASWRHLPSVTALFDTAYGRTLILKLGLVAVALTLGWWNWKRVTPRLATPSGKAALARFATFEFVVAQVILVVTAMLVRMSPTGMG